MPRWGILGTSFISHTVAAAIASSPNSTIGAVFGRDPARLAAFADKYAIPTRHATLEALVEDPDVDVVYVGLPSHLHAQASIAAARQGKAILSEKSLTTTMADARELIRVVDEQGVFFLEGLMYLSHPLMQEVVKIIQAGTLGTVRSVSGSYSSKIWERANPLGMGTIYNLGCYPVSLLHLVIQAASGDEAFARRQVQGQGNLSEDGTHVRDASLLVKFDTGAGSSGVLATIQSSDTIGKDFSFVVQGSEKYLRFGTNPWLPQEDSYLVVGTYGKGETKYDSQSPRDAFQWQVAKVEECLAAGLKQAPRPSPRWEDSLAIMGLLTEWEEAITGRKVR